MNLIYQYFREVGRDFRVPHNAGHEYHKCSRDSIKTYADSIGADYKFLDKPLSVVHYGIFIPFLEGWCEEYDNICFIDSDVLATINADDIFVEENIAPGKISTYIEDRNVKILHPNINFIGHANTGVVIFPRSVYGKFKTYIDDELDSYEQIRSAGLPDRIRAFGRFDQPFINLYIEKYGEVHVLPPKFNWALTRLPFTDKRWSQTLIHYNGFFKENMYADYRSSNILSTGEMMKAININIK